MTADRIRARLRTLPWGLIADSAGYLFLFSVSLALFRCGGVFDY